MNRNVFLPAVLAAVVTVGLASASAFAAEHENGDANDAAALAQAKITLVQAISAAEQNTGANALNATVEDVNGAPRFAVEVVKGKTVQTVLVDAQTGQVVKVTAAEDENHENNGEEESE
ncbi:MAG: PepSY domain-containing protein [Pseudomonadota bacterium]